eukprot:COSAG04_NODE_14608_length_561_cov_2.675325_1_plen_43_part_10
MAPLATQQPRNQVGQLLLLAVLGSGRAGSGRRAHEGTATGAAP